MVSLSLLSCLSKTIFHVASIFLERWVFILMLKPFSKLPYKFWTSQHDTERPHLTQALFFLLFAFRIVFSFLCTITVLVSILYCFPILFDIVSYLYIELPFYIYICGRHWLLKKSFWITILLWLSYCFARSM